MSGLARLFLLILCVWHIDAGKYPSIQDCKVTPLRNTHLVELLCRLRTINSEIDETNFGVIPPSNTAKIHIECNDVLFFQSALQNRSFFHLRNLRSLNVQYCKIGNVPKEAFAGLTRLRNLTLNTFNTDWSAMSLKIAPQAFTDQIKLERLDLADNNILSLPPHLFCNLDNLTFLNFSSNKLQDVTTLSFNDNLGKCAPSLRWLDLSYNAMVHIPSSAFEALKNLTTLNISRNSIREIADQVFYGMYSLESLDISGNALTTLPPELFKENKRLTRLYTQNNSISVLAPGLFTGLNMMLELDMSRNLLTNTWVNSETFMDLIRLATLDISFNQITRLDVATFRDLTNLQFLNLRNNLIEYIADDTFRELFRLHTLILSNNRLMSLGENTLSGLVSLLDLSIDNNSLSVLHSKGLTNSTRLKNFQLSNNSIFEIPPLVNSLPNLEVLDLSSNKIEQIDKGSLMNLKTLTALYLQQNNILSIEKPNFADLEAVQVINLASNTMRTIQNGAFDGNRNLRAVRVDNNFLTNVHGLFSNLTNLKWLNISKNHLAMFDYAFIPRELEYLDLRYNPLNELGNHFEIENQLHLKVLDASHNKIREVSANSVPDSIQILFLNNNLINTVQPYTFFKKKNLTRVDLFSNRIRKIDQNALRLSVLNPLKPIPEFFLAENPFECDCTLEWLQKVNIQQDPHHTPRVVDLTSIMCHLMSRRGPSFIPLFEAHKLEFLCQYDTHCFPLCHCCDFDACDCEMTCPHNCTCFHDESWTANIVDCSSSGHNAMPDRIPMDASEAYLDGNVLTSLSSHTFIGRKNLRVLFLNSSYVDVIHNRTFNGLRKLRAIHLNNNQLTALKGYEFEFLKLLRELYLQENKISVIANNTFSSLISLEVLRLDGNLLHTIVFNKFRENILLGQLWISGNPWSCECSFVSEAQMWLEDSAKIVMDKHDLYCYENVTHTYHIPSYNDSCGSQNYTISYQQTSAHTFLLFPTISLVAATLLLVVILVVFCNKDRMRVWVYSKYGVRLCQRKLSEDEAEKSFDAFVSYSTKDEVFVKQILAPELENGSPSFKLCLHYRDFAVGSFVPETIVRAVEGSKRTIMILSENFIKSEWSKYDFQSVHHEMFRDRKRRLIVILLGEVPQRDLDPDLKLYLKTNTFLKWGDTQFWEKLKFAMPDARPTPAHPMRPLRDPQGSRQPTPTSTLSQTPSNGHRSSPRALSSQGQPNYNPAPRPRPQP